MKSVTHKKKHIIIIVMLIVTVVLVIAVGVLWRLFLRDKTTVDSGTQSETDTTEGSTEAEEDAEAAHEAEADADGAAESEETGAETTQTAAAQESTESSDTEDSTIAMEEIESGGTAVGRVTEKSAKLVLDSGGQWSGEIMKRYQAYADLVQIYMDARNTVYTSADPYDVVDEVSNSGVNYEYAYASINGGAPAFLMYDLNGDGTEELFLGLYYANSGEFTIYTAYTFWNEQAVEFIDAVYTTKYSICNTGVIMCVDKASSTDYQFVYYALPQNGIELSTVDYVYVSGYLESGTEEYYHSDNFLTDNPMSKDEYNQLVNSYTELELSPVVSSDSSIADLREGRQ